MSPSDYVSAWLNAAAVTDVLAYVVPVLTAACSVRCVVVWLYPRTRSV